MNARSMNNVIAGIVARKRRCVFVSTHLDDAVLSCGNLISQLAEETEVSIASIFTEASGKPETLSAKAFLRQCGVRDAQQLFSMRRKEDDAVMRVLRVQYQHLGFPDACWRKRTGLFSRLLGNILPELAHIYPTYRFHITKGRVSGEDRNLIDQIEVAVHALASNEKNTIFFFPLGLGKHVDHVITHLVGTRFPAEQVIFYSDFPYCLTDSPDEALLIRHGFCRVESDVDPKAKHSLIAMYATQHLFDGDIPEVPEVCYVPKNLLQ